MYRYACVLPVAVVCLAVIVFCSGCADVGYNPYVQNDGRRSIGKSIGGVAEKANDELSEADARFENLFN